MTNFLARELRDLSHVPRWGIARTIKQQSVADHTFYVACYAVHISEFIKWGTILDRYVLLQYALEHDIEESFMSDIPGPSKRNVVDKPKYESYVRNQNRERFGVTVEPNDEAKLIIKCADLVDECMYLSGEAQMGNGSVKAFIESAEERLWQSIENLPCRYNKKRDLRKTVADQIMLQRSGQSKPPRNSSDVAP